MSSNPFSENLLDISKNLFFHDAKTQNSDNEVSISESKDLMKESNIMSKCPNLKELYPSMNKSPTKSILRKPLKNVINSEEEIFISDLSLKNDEKTGKIKKRDCKIMFNDEINVIYITSLKKYNETGFYSGQDDGNCSCFIF